MSFLKTRVRKLETEIIFKEGGLLNLPSLFSENGWQRVFIVIDPGLSGLPWAERLLRKLKEKPRKVLVFQDFDPNPKTTSAEKAAAAANRFAAQAILAIGGGSAIDLAKGAALLATNGGRALDWVREKEFPKPPLPVTALPTTCGTGSEVTWVSVLTNPEAQTKISIKGPALFPRYALLDPRVLETLPPHLVGETGMDALTHALEAFTGNKATAETDTWALEAIDLIFKNLFNASYGPQKGRKKALGNMLRASTTAGLAFGHSDVGGVHCLSESLGGVYDVPHGLTNAILLEPVLKYHRPVIQTRLETIDNLLVSKNENIQKHAPGDLFFKKLSGLLKAVKIPSFEALKIPREGFEKIARMAEENGSNPSNPQKMTARDYLKILHSLD